MTRSWEDYVLSGTDARIIAAWWQNGGASGLAALASSGAILDKVYAEISASIVLAPSDGDKVALRALGQYCERNGPRGRVPGWNRNHAWSSAAERSLEARFGIESA